MISVPCSNREVEASEENSTSVADVSQTNVNDVWDVQSYHIHWCIVSVFGWLAMNRAKVLD